MNSKFKYLMLMIAVIMGCKTTKDIQLQETSLKYKLKSDSTYLVQFSDSTTTMRTYLINYDSSGRPSTVKIDEVVKGAKKGVNQGRLKKDVEEESVDKTLKRKVERQSKSFLNSWLTFIVILGIVLGLIRWSKMLKT